MKNLKRIALIILLTWSMVYGWWAIASAAVPHLINYQGRLTDASNNPLDGSYSLTFRIYDAETAGNLLWEETQTGVIIQKGIFNILLGSVANLNLAFDKPYFLEIKVGSEVMTPRQRITSSGYALRAEKADTAGALNMAGQQGDILYYNGSSWTRLPAGTNGYMLKSQGPATNPVWAEPASNTSEGTFVVDTEYTNNTGHKLMVVAYCHENLVSNWWFVDFSGRIGFSSADTTVARVSQPIGSTAHDGAGPYYYSFTFIVPNGWKWKVQRNAYNGNPSFVGTADRIEAWQL